MTLRNRFTLVGLGVIIFLIITPGLVLYARGFKIDWENRTLVKTGALVVRTEPTKADIYLNDEKYGSDTPANVRFLTPSDYNIRVEKNGYQSWTKRLSVKSQLVTWANLNREFITLFRSTPEEKEKIAIKNSTVSRTYEEIIYVTPTGLGLIDVNSANNEQLFKINDFQLPLLSSEIKWRNSSQVISLFANKPTLDLLQSRVADINQLESDRNHIVIKLGLDLYSVKNGVLNLIEKNITDFTLTDDTVWYIQGKLLKNYNLPGNKYETTAHDLPLAKESQIIRAPNQIYLILDGMLYLFNGNLEQISTTAKYAYWDHDSNVLLFANDHEVSIYDPNFKDATLIVRSLTTITKPHINKETGYIFYQNEGKIKAIELDERDHRNIFTIADAMNDFVVSKDGEKLYTISAEEIKQYIIR